MLDFEKLLAESKSDGEGIFHAYLDTTHPNQTTADAPPPPPDSDSDADNDPDRPVFSLITGTYRQAKRFGLPSKGKDTVAAPSPSDEVILRNQDTAVALKDSAGGRSWHKYLTSLRA